MGKSESQMDIMEKSSKPGKRRWTVAEIGLSVLLLMVSCALAGLVLLYTSAVKGKDHHGKIQIMQMTAAKTSVSFLGVFVTALTHQNLLFITN